MLSAKEASSIYPDICDLISGLSYGLKISEPDFIIADYNSPLLRPGMWAQVLHKQDYKQLKRSLLIINREIVDYHEILVGVITHELMHMHQMEYTPDIFAMGQYGRKYAYGKDVYTDAAEINADAMGICVMSLLTGYDIRDCTAALCHNEQNEAKKEYEIRIKYATINYKKIKEKINAIY